MTTTGPNTAARVADLIAALEAVIDEHGPDATFAIVHQPAYPLRLDVVGIAATTDVVDEITADDPDANEDTLAELPSVWIVADQPNAHDVNPYAPRGLFDAARDW